LGSLLSFIGTIGFLTIVALSLNNNKVEKTTKEAISNLE
jgi:hypothetical protein